MHRYHLFPFLPPAATLSLTVALLLAPYPDLNPFLQNAVLHGISTYHHQYIVVMMAATPLGTLGVLPPEIRNIIYGHLICGSYLIGWTLPDRRSWRTVNFAILATSKQINAEALRIFYTASQFLYEFVYDHITGHFNCQDLEVWHTITDKVFENLTNITLTVNMRKRVAGYIMSAFEQAWNDDFFRWLSEISLRRLYRDNIVRKRLNIRYFGLDLANYFDYILTLPLFQDTKHLTWFKSILIEFVSTEKQKNTEYQSGWFEEQQYEQSRRYVAAVRADLETTLGPATTIEGLAATQALPSQASGTHSVEEPKNLIDFNRSSHYFDWRLEFHPLDHTAKTSSLMLEAF